MISGIDLAIPDKVYLSENRGLIKPSYLVDFGIELCLTRPGYLVGINKTLPEKFWLMLVYDFA